MRHNGLRKRAKRWSAQEREILKRDFNLGLSPEQSHANLPGRTIAAIATQRTQSGLNPERAADENTTLGMTVLLTRKTIARIDEFARALGIKRAPYIRRVVEQTVDGVEARVETHVGRSLSKKANQYLLAEALKRRMGAPQLISELLEAIAEGRLCNAVLDDGNPDPQPRRARA